MTAWVERRPAAPADVARVQDGPAEPPLRLELAQQELLDLELAAAVVGERLAVQAVLRRRRRDTRTVRPD